MNHYLEPSGFLGTGASLAADITLIAYLLLIIPGMLAGWYFARIGKHRPLHKWVMTIITIVNWVLIIGLMFFAYTFDVSANIGEQPSNFRYLMPTIHALFGFPAQILATIIIINMFREDQQVAAATARGERNVMKYWWKRAKPIMILTNILWLITATFGVVSYLIRYDVLTIPASADTIAPVVTEEPDALDVESTEEPQATEEADTPVETEEPESPAETEEPQATEEADTPMETEEPQSTQEAQLATTEEVDNISPAITEEADDDDDSGQGRGRGRGRGRGGDDDDDSDDD